MTKLKRWCLEKTGKPREWGPQTGPSSQCPYLAASDEKLISLIGLSYTLCDFVVHYLYY